MAKKDFTKEDQNLENVQETLSSAGMWIEKNQNAIEWTVFGVVLVVLAWMLLNTYVIKPKHLEASNENAKAVVYFGQGDFEKALNGDDADCMGFEAIANKYGYFQEGKLAALYAGICYYQQGDYEQAAAFLKKFKADDVNIAPAAAQLLGDAYVQLEDYNKAVSAFEAAAKSGNEIIAPMSLKKAGLAYMELGKKASAKKAFEAIKANYPTSAEAQDIDKFIALAE
ncbi:MAG: tetratricopeptide repeat protein [Paludibacteraceae bacterium]|nr:tetratricopeptide repeat protein [Paludibacteraceae bacterium]